MNEGMVTRETQVRFGRTLTLTVAVDNDGRVVAIRDVAPPPDASDSHELRLQRHAVASVGRLISTVDRGPHDTPALLAQAWGFAVLQAANTLRRVEEQASRLMYATAADQGGLTTKEG